MELKDVKIKFTYHPLSMEQHGKQEQLRLQAVVFAGQIFASTPEGREQSLAITSLEQALFWSIAAIEREE